MNNALVFGGGGGKGAYQIGVWKALRELGLEKSFRRVLGTSVGALNAALFAQRDFARAEHIWRTITRGTILADNFGKGEALASQDGLRQLLLRYVCLRPSDLPVFVCCSRVTSPPSVTEAVLGPAWTHSPFPPQLTLRDMKPFGIDLGETYHAEYFKLNELPQLEQVQCLMASAAMPFMFDSVEINGAAYRDGGIQEEHNLPYRKAESLGHTRILAVSLDSGVVHEQSCGGARVMTLYPSAPLGDLVDGTLDFEASSAAWRIQLGYRDTISRGKEICDFLKVSAFDGKSVLTQEQKERLRQIFRNP